MSSSANFTDAELACPCCSKNLCVDLLLDALELLRAAIQRPILINSGYRCPPHNKAIGGATNSQHTIGQAADIRVSGMTPKDLYHVALASGAFGGFGVAQSFLHVDVRITGAKWCYDEQGKECAWDNSLDTADSKATAV